MTDGRGPRRAALITAGIATMVALLAALAPRSGNDAHDDRREQAGAHRLELAPGLGFDGFARATAVRSFHLPADHGPHFEYQTEWWYYTGNVAAEDGRRFGFQLTFFRRGLSPGPPPGGPGLASNQVYFAHMAITDVRARRHIAAERFSRGAGDLAGATGDPFAVWLEGWKVESLNEDGSAVRLDARDTTAGLSLHLELTATKPLAAHGDRGLSAKSVEPGNASYYVGYTRMRARGRLEHLATVVGAGNVPLLEVAGEAWFDHEWSTSALDAGALGWDWFSLQLDDGRELMHFQIRREDGSIESVSGGTIVERDGRSHRLAGDEVAVDVLDRWTSPASRATYPSRWRLRVPSEGLDLIVEPLVEGQEMHTSFVYWEGAVRVSGSPHGRPVSGQGYVELTGYGQSMQAVF